MPDPVPDAAKLTAPSCGDAGYAARTVQKAESRAKHEGERLANPGDTISEDPLFQDPLQEPF